jgi:hypothetical protein
VAAVLGGVHERPVDVPEDELHPSMYMRLPPLKPRP